MNCFHSFTGTVNDHEVNFTLELPNILSQYEIADQVLETMTATEQLENDPRAGSAPQRIISC